MAWKKRTNPGQKMVKDHFKQESDINHLVARHLGGGHLGNPAATRQPIFGDFSSMDYMQMLNAVADTEQQFFSLPSRIRDRFRNDPYQVVRFVENPANRAEAIKLGLLTPTQAEVQAMSKPASKPTKNPSQTDLVEASEANESPKAGKDAQTPKND